MAALIPSQLYGADEEKPADRGSLLGSVALNVGRSVVNDIVAPAAELVQSVTGNKENIFGDTAKLARDVGEKIDKEIPEERRKDRDAALFPEPGQRSVTQNFGSTLAMKGSGAGPSMALYVAAGPAAPFVGAAQGAGTRISEVKGRIEKASEDELIKEFPKYVEYMTLGLPENEARKLLADDMLKGTMMPATLGGAAGAVPFGRALATGAKHGVLKGAAVGAAEGLVGNAIQGAGNEVSNQQGEMNVGKRVDYDPVSITRATANSAVEGAALAGVMAGAGGALGKAHGKAGDWASKQLDKKAARDALVEGNAPDPAQTDALSPEGKTALDEQIDAAAAGSPDALKPPGAPDPNAPPGTTPPPGTPPGAPPPAAGPSEAVVNAIHAAATKRTKAMAIHDAVEKSLKALGVDAPSPTEVVNILSGMKASGELSWTTSGGYRTTRQAAPKTPKLEKTPVTVVEAVEAAKPPEAVETKANVPGDQPSPVAAGVMDVVKPPETVVAKTNVPGDEASAAAQTAPITPEGNRTGKLIPEERIATMRPLAAAFARKLNRRYEALVETQGREAADAWADSASERIKDKNGKFQQSLTALRSAADTMNVGVADRAARLTAAGDALTGKGAPKKPMPPELTVDMLPGGATTEAPKPAAPRTVGQLKAKVAGQKAATESAAPAKKVIKVITKKAKADPDAPAKLARIAEKMSSPELPATTEREARPAVVVDPASDSARKVFNKVAENMATEDKVAAADKAAEKARNDKLRAEGKPVVLSAPAKPETAETRLDRHIDHAIETFRKEDAKRKVEKRAEKIDANEALAKETAESVWSDENNAHTPAREAELTKQDQEAATGDTKAVVALYNRVRNAVIAARIAHVQIAKTRATDAAKAGDNARNPTPWRTYFREAELFLERMDRLRKAGEGAKNKEALHEAVREFVQMESLMRAGRYDEAHANRIERVDERTAEENDRKLNSLKKGKDGDNKSQSDLVDSGVGVDSSEAGRIKDDLENKLAAGIDEAAGLNPDDYGDGRATAAREGAGLHEDGEFSKRSNLLIRSVLTKRVPSKWASLREHLSAVWDQLSKDEQGLHKAIYDKLDEYAGDDARVFVIPDAVWNSHGLQEAGGFYKPNRDQTKSGIIFLPERYAMHPLVVAHEGAHAVTDRAILYVPEFKKEVEQLMRDILASLPEGGARQTRLNKQYGFHNAAEFVAEIHANPQFRDMLAAIPLKKPIVTPTGTLRTMLDKFVNAVKNLLGIKKLSEYTALEKAMLYADDAIYLDGVARDEFAAERAKTTDARPGMVQDPLVRPSPVREYFEARVPAKIDWKLRSQRVLDKVASVVQMTNNSDHLYGPDRPARQLAEAMGKMSTMKDKILSERAEPLIKNMHAAQRKFDQRTDGRSQWTDFAELAHDASRAGVHPDQIVTEQFKKDNPSNWYQTEVHKDLSARYEKMPQELKDLFHEATSYFRETQNQMSMGLIRNALKAASSDGKGSEALAQRIFNKKLTDADKAVLGKDGLLSSIQKAGALSRIEGPYVPFMRRGDFVVTARHEIEAPAGARRINEEEAVDAKGNTYEFKTEDAAKAFVQKTLVDRGLRPTDVSKLGIDATTGSHYRLDAEGKKKPINFKEEPNAEARWRVTIEPKHVEFHEQASAAAESRQGLIEKGLRDVTHVDVKKLDPAKMNDAFMPLQMQRMLNALQKREGFKKLDKNAQDELVRQLREAGIASMGSTRAQSHRLPRNNILGNSEDILKNTGVYASSTAGYLARLRYRPDVDAALKKMTDYTESMTRAGNDEYLPALRRQRLNELTKRAHAMNDIDADNMFHRVTSRLLQLSYLDKLASPAFHVINSSEPWTITLPVLAARHGVLPTIKALSGAYKLIGAHRVVGAGMRDTYRAGKDGHNADLTDYQTTLTQRVAKDTEHGEGLVKLFNHLHDIGLMSRDAGMELSHITDASTGRVGRTADRADLMARQVGAAIESVNRAVSATAAYKMERAKGADHAKAMEYAVEQVHDTMKDYASWNAAPIFNHPVGRLALQFKKYAQGTYYLLGKTAIASFKGDKQAMKTFAYLMATHMVTAGALGMPLEPIRLGLMAAGLLGITDKTYEDFEQGVRAGGANVLGVEGGQIFTRGLARWAGIDLASRVSFNSLLTSGQDPKSMKPDDLWAWIAKNFAGAPASLLIDGVQGFQALGKGDVVEASRLLVPLKIWADSVQAYQWNTEGKKSASGRQQMDPISFGDALIKVAGFTPGSVAERNEKTFAIKGDQRQFKKAREQLSNDWINASPDEKTAMWREITKWNAGQPANAQIKLGDLMNQKRRRDQEKFSDDRANGMNLSKRDRHLLTTNDYYNVPITH